MPHLPGTELTVSPLGLGSYHLTGGFGPVDPRQFARLVGAAVHRGITLFDTAPTYGDAEVHLGRALHPWRHQVVLGSKVGVWRPGRPVGEVIISSCEASLRRLGTDYLDLYHLHYDDAQVPVDAVVAALDALKEAGKIRYYGLGLGHVSPLRWRSYAGVGRFSTGMQEVHPLMPGHPENRLPGEVEPLPCIAYSVTARGLLTGEFSRDSLAAGDVRRQDALFQRENARAGRRVVRYLSQLGRRVQRTPAQLSIAWALAQPGVEAALTSTRSEAHLQENLGGAHYTWPEQAWEEFNAFVYRLQEETRGQRLDQVALLLRQLPPTDEEEARTDLIYLLESFHWAELASSDQLLSLYLEVEAAPTARELAAVWSQLQQVVGYR